MSARLLGLAVLGLAAGCATAHPFAPAGGRHEHAPGFAIELPAGWVGAEFEEGHLFTRDGALLQRIEVLHALVDPAAPLSKGLRAALPEEQAELLVARFEAMPGEPVVLDVRPATVSGAPGSRTTARLRDADGLQYTVVVVAATVGTGEWRLVYRAPTRHYFALDLATFERAVESFRIVPRRAE